MCNSSSIKTFCISNNSVVVTGTFIDCWSDGKSIFAIQLDGRKCCCPTDIGDNGICILYFARKNLRFFSIVSLVSNWQTANVSNCFWSRECLPLHFLLSAQPGMFRLCRQQRLAQNMGWDPLNKFEVPRIFNIPGVDLNMSPKVGGHSTKIQPFSTKYEGCRQIPTWLHLSPFHWDGERAIFSQIDNWVSTVRCGKL